MKYKMYKEGKWCWRRASHCLPQASSLSVLKQYQEEKENIIYSEKYSEMAQFEVAQTLLESLINPFFKSEDAIKYSLYGYIEWLSLGKSLPTN